jgi:8-oxo-dGTP pyrophosphatase MutT (NUDIX family)
MAFGLAGRPQETSARVAVTDADPADAGVVRAAGGLLVRDGADGPEVLLVHRPRYDDWSFPKGKRDGPETDEETALREVAEETGIAAVLGPRLGEVRYRDNKGRPKVVHYWIMEPRAVDRQFVPGDEVDDLRWCSVADAERLLTYAHDRALLDHVRRNAGESVRGTE